MPYLLFFLLCEKSCKDDHDQEEKEGLHRGRGSDDPSFSEERGALHFGLLSSTLFPSQVWYREKVLKYWRWSTRRRLALVLVVGEGFFFGGFFSSTLVGRGRG